MLRFLSIVLLSIVAAVFYGIVHDQITIRISLEYFTVLHPHILPAKTPPGLLALMWGILATWWVGLILGIVLAIASRAGKRPPLTATQLVLPIAVLLLVMATGAAVAGLIGYELGVHGLIHPSSFVQETIAPDRYNRLFAAGATHLASYGIGFVGGITLAVWAWQKRKRISWPSQEVVS